MSKSKRATVDRAVATIRRATNTDALKVSITSTLGQAMQQSPDWATASDVQNAVKVWSAGAAAIGANAKVIAGLLAELRAAGAKQNELRRDWLSAKKQVLSIVTVLCGGSADRVRGFDLDVITHGRIGALEAPEELAVNPGKVTGEVVAKWAKGLARHGFVVQHATDPTNPATISATMPCTKTHFMLGGVPSNANVSMRVAAIDPASVTGMSPWSAWVVGNAR